MTGKSELISFKDFLAVIVKTKIPELPYNRLIDPQVISSYATVPILKLPLEFVPVNSTEASQNSAKPVLYKLKHGINNEYVSDFILPQVLSMGIDSFHSVIKKEPLTDEKVLQTCSTPLSNSSLKTVIKTEPPNSDDEDSTSNSTLPVIMKAYSCEGSHIPNKSDHIQRQNVCNTISGVEKALFPLVFVLKGVMNNIIDNNKSLIYALKQGLNGAYVTQNAVLQLHSVQINFASQGVFKLKCASALKNEGPIDIDVKVEYSSFLNKDLSLISCDDDLSDIPVNTNISGNFQAVPTTCHQHGNDQLFHLSRDNLNCVSALEKQLIDTSNPVPEKGNIFTDKLNSAPTSIKQHSEKSKATNEKSIDIANDEDYRFLMSLLPELKRLPPDEKSNAKKKIKDIVMTSRLVSSKVQFEHSKTNVKSTNIQSTKTNIQSTNIQSSKSNVQPTNIYRDCGVLPISGGWKF